MTIRSLKNLIVSLTIFTRESPSLFQITGISFTLYLFNFAIYKYYTSKANLSNTCLDTIFLPILCLKALNPHCVSM